MDQITSSILFSILFYLFSNLAAISSFTLDYIDFVIRQSLCVFNLIKLYGSSGVVLYAFGARTTWRSACKPGYSAK